MATLYTFHKKLSENRHSFIFYYFFLVILFMMNILSNTKKIYVKLKKIKEGEGR